MSSASTSTWSSSSGWPRVTSLPPASRARCCRVPSVTPWGHRSRRRLGRETSDARTSPRSLSAPHRWLLTPRAAAGQVAHPTPWLVGRARGTMGRDPVVRRGAGPTERPARVVARARPPRAPPRARRSTRRRTPSSPRTQSSRVGSTPSQPDRATRSPSGTATSASTPSSRSPTRCCRRPRCRRGRAARRATSSSRCCTCASKTTSATSTSSRPAIGAASCTRSSRSSVASTSIATSPAPIRCSSPLDELSWTATAREVVEQVTREVLDDFERRGSAPYEILWDVEKKRIVRDVLRTLDADAADVELMAVEHPFGGDERPFTIELPSGQTLRFRGTIDRIDRLHDRLRVIDYKTGTHRDRSQCACRHRIRHPPPAADLRARRAGRVRPGCSRRRRILVRLVEGRLERRHHPDRCRRPRAVPALARHDLDGHRRAASFLLTRARKIGSRSRTASTASTTASAPPTATEPGSGCSTPTSSPATAS